jgi:hypothetical protein
MLIVMFWQGFKTWGRKPKTVHFGRLKSKGEKMERMLDE